MADAYNFGSVNYASWIMASINREKLMTKEKIEMMFRIVERITNKKISGDSLFSVFGLGG